MLARALLDHIPPIFGFHTFPDLASQYGGGGKSFKECMNHLENSSRKIADAHLHSQIRKKETQ
jgi:Sec-independent protein translocase protein TatA